MIRLQWAARGFNLLPRQPLHSALAGRHATRIRGRGLDFDELRAYQPGDDVRSIDWKVTARTRKPHTRVYTDERERRVLLVVDQRLAMFFGTRVQMKSVTAAELAALLAWHVVDAGDRVGAVVFDERGPSRSSPIAAARRCCACWKRWSSAMRRWVSTAASPAIRPGSTRCSKAWRAARRTTG